MTHVRADKMFNGLKSIEASAPCRLEARYIAGDVDRTQDW
jgi:hypothetical protein